MPVGDGEKATLLWLAGVPREWEDSVPGQLGGSGPAVTVGGATASGHGECLW